MDIRLLPCLLDDNFESIVAAASLLTAKSPATSVLSIWMHTDLERRKEDSGKHSFQHNQVVYRIIQHKSHSLVAEHGFAGQVAAKRVR